MEKELWKSIEGYDGLYEISTLGRVKRLSRISTDSMGRVMLYKEKLMAVQISKSTGYPYVCLTKDGVSKAYNIHTLIAKAFIPNPDNLPCVNHIDENRSNSVLSNLEWCSYSYNNSYGSANKKRKLSLRDTLIGRHKIIYQFTKTGELLNVFDCGVAQLEEKLGYSIKDCLIGKCKTANGYVFSYYNNFVYKENIPLKHQKYVIQIDENGNEVERYKSVSDAARQNGIERHCFSRKAPIGGIIAINDKMFIIEQKENEFIPKGHKGVRPNLLGKGAKAVCQYTKNGEFVEKYESIREAAESIGVPKSAPEISNCCNGKLKTARGFVWAYDGEKPRPFKNNAIRKIAQYKINGEFIAEHDSIIDAIHSLGKGTPTCIGNNLAGRSHSAYGYIWKYKNDD